MHLMPRLAQPRLWPGPERFASGDRLLDASGNLLLDSSGNVMLDSGGGNCCCSNPCGSTFPWPFGTSYLFECDSIQAFDRYTDPSCSTVKMECGPVSATLTGSCIFIGTANTGPYAYGSWCGSNPDITQYGNWQCCSNWGSVELRFDSSNWQWMLLYSYDPFNSPTLFSVRASSGSCCSTAPDSPTGTYSSSKCYNPQSSLSTHFYVVNPRIS